MKDMTLFSEKAPGIMVLLMQDFDMDMPSAAAIVGNLGHESGGFKFLQELKPMVPGSRGGWGWAQWTGPRRRQFESYVKRNNLDPASDFANYAFLHVELTTTEKRAVPAVKNAKTLAQKVKAFEMSFERAGIKHYPRRNKYASQARAAFKIAYPYGLPSAKKVYPVGLPTPETMPDWNPPAIHRPWIMPKALRAATSAALDGKTGWEYWILRFLYRLKQAIRNLW
jgi:hypothetical protein